MSLDSKEILRASLKQQAPPFGLVSNLFQRIQRHSAIRIKRDYAHKNLVLCTGLSAYSENPLNYFTRGKSSIGKTHSIREMLKYFPKEDLWMLGGLSPKALIHEYGTLVDELGQPIPSDWVNSRIQELEAGRKLTKKESRVIVAQAKQDFQELLQNSRYVVDLTGKILAFLESPDEDTWLILRPILSHDTLETSYKFPEKRSDGTLRTKTVVLKGYLAVICATTDEKFIEDLATRCLTSMPETTEEKYEEAILLIGAKLSQPWDFDMRSDTEYQHICEYIQRLKTTVRDHKWIIVVPFGKEFARIYPHRLPRDMRDFDHFMQLVKQFTLLHLFQRPRIGCEGKTYVLSTIEDLIYALQLFADIEETTRSGLAGHIIAFFKKAILPLTSDGSLAELSDLCERYNATASPKIGMDAVYGYVNALDKAGWVVKENHPHDKRKKIVRSFKNGESSLLLLIKQKLPFFTETELKNWFIALQNYLCEKHVHIYADFSTGAPFYQPDSYDLDTFIHNDTHIQTLFQNNFFLDASGLKINWYTEKKPEKSLINKNQQSLGDLLPTLCKGWVTGYEQDFIELATVEGNISKDTAQSYFHQLRTDHVIGLDDAGRWRFAK
jgi:hypothetical protein